jgi:uncharacterized protein (TIGR03067 family)
MHLSISMTLFISALACAHPAQDALRPTGTWTVIDYDQNGVRPPAEIIKQMRVVVQAERIIIKPRIVAQYKPVFDGTKKAEVSFTVEADKTEEATYKLDPAKGRIDLVWRGPRGETKTTLGIYELEDDALKICFALPGKNRPKKFPDNPKSGVVRMVLKREPK